MSPENQAILNRFPEGTTYFLPLYLAMALRLTKEEVFGLSEDDIRINAGVVIIHRLARYDRKSNRVKFTICNHKTILLIPESKSILTRVLDDHDILYQRLKKPMYSLNSDELTKWTNGSSPFYPLLIHNDGTYISPLGINYVTRVVQGKVSSIEIVQPNWSFNNLKNRKKSHSYSERRLTGMDGSHI